MTDPSASSTSVSLLVRIQEADEESWSRFVQIYGPLIYQWCRKVPLQPQDAADVSQAVFSAVYQKISSYDAGRADSTFRGWLWTVTRNKIRDHFRALSEHEQPRGGDHQQLISESLPEDEPQDEGDEQNLLLRAVELLKSEFEPRTWDAFWRAAVQKEPVSQIANEMQMSNWAVYQAKSRVLRRARQELSGLLPEDVE